MLIQTQSVTSQILKTQIVTSQTPKTQILKKQILKTQTIRLQRLKPIKKFKIFHLPILITVWVVCISYYAYHHRRIHKPSIKK